MRTPPFLRSIIRSRRGKGTVLVCLLVLVMTLVNNVFVTRKHRKSDSSIVATRMASRLLILKWTRLSSIFEEEEFKQTRLDQCEYRCAVTDNRSEVENAKAILIVPRWNAIKNLPAVRHPWQMFVYFLDENPRSRFRHFEDVKLKNVPPEMFNWTMTYRLDADVPNPYGKAFANQINLYYLPDKEIVRLVEGKVKIAAWFSSNCVFQRTEYMREIVKHLNVSIYGECLNGYKSCPYNWDRYYHRTDQCEGFLRKHLFYFALENSICDHYTTEKLAFHFGTVPIVFNRTVAARFIPHSGFISVSDFASPKLLAEYLRYLDGNRTAYRAYFDWRRYPEKQDWMGDVYSAESGACLLCKMLHNESASNHKRNVSEWVASENCYNLQYDFLKNDTGSKKVKFGNALNFLQSVFTVGTDFTS